MYMCVYVVHACDSIFGAGGNLQLHAELETCSDMQAVV